MNKFNYGSNCNNNSINSNCSCCRDDIKKIFTILCNDPKLGQYIDFDTFIYPFIEVPNVPLQFRGFDVCNPDLIRAIDNNVMIYLTLCNLDAFGFELIINETADLNNFRCLLSNYLTTLPFPENNSPEECCCNNSIWNKMYNPNLNIDNEFTILTRGLEVVQNAKLIGRIGNVLAFISTLPLGGVTSYFVYFVCANSISLFSQITVPDPIPPVNVK